MADLPTNLKDDILDSSVNTRRKYRMIENGDGTYSFEDLTEYNQVGDEYGAGLINETNKQVNARVEKAVVVRDLDTIGAITQPGFIPDALALKDVNDSLGNMEFQISDNKPQWREVGADTWNFFSSDIKLHYHYQGNNGTTTYNTTFELDKNKKYIFVFVPLYNYVTNGTNIIDISVGGLYERFTEANYVSDTRAYMVSNATFITASTHIDATNVGVSTYYIEY